MGSLMSSEATATATIMKEGVIGIQDGGVKMFGKMRSVVDMKNMKIDCGGLMMLMVCLVAIPCMALVGIVTPIGVVLIMAAPQWLGAFLTALTTAGCFATPLALGGLYMLGKKQENKVLNKCKFCDKPRKIGWRTCSRECGVAHGDSRRHRSHHRPAIKHG